MVSTKSDDDSSTASDDLVISPPDFSSSEDEGGEDETRVNHPVVCLTLAEMRGRSAQSLKNLATVRRHNHRDRDLASFPTILLPSLDLLEGASPISRIRVEEMTLDDFNCQFLLPRCPAILLGAAANWRATARWSSEDELLKHYGDVPFKVSEIAPPFACAKPLKIELPLRVYLDETKATQADFPFYIFERDLGGPRAPLLEDFEPPAYFRDDLYDTTEYTRAFFPLYRYYVIGVERTGSNLHVDPSCTTAWNTLLCGRKRWVLFPPGDSEDYRTRIGASSLRDDRGDVKPPAYWWLDVYPELLASGAAKELGMLEYVQRPGETIFVPFGWWHAVLNIGFTAAVTQNLLPPGTLEYAWPQLAQEWPDFAPTFAKLLQEKRPDVVLPEAASLMADQSL